MALAGNNGYGNFGYGNIDRGGGGGGGSFLNGINFLSGDFDVGIDGDLLLGALYLTTKVLHALTLFLLAMGGISPYMSVT